MNKFHYLLKQTGKICLTGALLLLTLWFLPAAHVVLALPEWMDCLFWLIAIILFAGGFSYHAAHKMLAIIAGTFLLYFISLTPRQQFANTKFLRIFAVKPDIEYLADGKFKVLNLRDNRYPVNYDEYAPYDDVFRSDLTFDPAKLEKVQLAVVYWEDFFYIAHNMLNFHFSDGKNLTVSVEPRTPEGVDREAFTCLCKQHEVLLILSVPEDLFDLRTKIRGEDLYLYELDLTREEAGKLLDFILKKTRSLARNPEFYHLTAANCITTLWPGFQQAKPEIKCNWRLYFNGFIDRMFFEQNLLKHRKGESFEALKSRSLIPGKSQGEL